MEKRTMNNLCSRKTNQEQWTGIRLGIDGAKRARITASILQMIGPKSRYRPLSMYSKG
jgi:hypothetical protein